MPYCPELSRPDLSSKRTWHQGIQRVVIRMIFDVTLQGTLSLLYRVTVCAGRNLSRLRVFIQGSLRKAILQGLEVAS